MRSMGANMKTERADDLIPPPISDLKNVAHLSREQATPFALTLNADEIVQLAKYLEVDLVTEPQFTGEISAWGENGWEVRGIVSAKIHQTCVVSLQPIISELNEEIVRHYLPAPDFGESETTELVIDLNADEGPESFKDSIDLGHLMIETLSLNIEPYPRAQGAELGQHVFSEPGITPLTDEAAKPFASLEALRRRMEENKE